MHASRSATFQGQEPQPDSAEVIHKRIRLFVVRHAEAITANQWDGTDQDRPLSAKGSRQAEALVPLLMNERLEAIYSSPYTRCRQTMQPLASALGLDVQEAMELAVGRSPQDALRLGRSADHLRLMFCSHSELVEDLVAWLSDQGVIDSHARPPRVSVWQLELENGAVMSASVMPLPR